MINNFIIAKSNKIYGKPFCFQMLARSLSGMDAYKASSTLDHVSGKYALALKKVIDSAIANAINKGIQNSMIVNEIVVGRGKYLKRIEFKGRGRIGSKYRPFSNLRVVLSSMKGVK